MNLESRQKEAQFCTGWDETTVQETWMKYKQISFLCQRKSVKTTKKEDSKQRQRIYSILLAKWSNEIDILFIKKRLM